MLTFIIMLHKHHKWNTKKMHSKKTSKRNSWFAENRILIKKIKKLELQLNNEKGGYVRLITTCSKVKS